MKKSIYRIVCVFLCFILLFSAGCSGGSAPTENGTNYFVMNGAKGDGRSEGSPAGSVASLIKIINEDADNGKIKDEKAIINIIELKEWKAAPINGAHKMAYIGNLPQCSVDLVIKSASRKKVHLAFGANISGKNSSFAVESGYENAIEFKNIVLVATGKASEMYLGGADIRFAEDVEFANTEGWNGGRIAKGKPLNIIHTKKSSESATFGKNMNVDIDAPAFSGILSIPGDGRHNHVFYNESFNITLNNGSIGKDKPFQISFGSGTSEDFHQTIITNNLNINVKNAANVDFLSGKNPNASFGVKGAVQVILNPAVNYNTTDFKSLQTVPQSTIFYLFYNNTKQADILSFTEEAGTYKVKNGVTVKAFNLVTGETFFSKKDTLTVVPGEYSLTVSKKNNKASLYVTNPVPDEETGEEKTEEVKDINISAIKKDTLTYKGDAYFVSDKTDAELPLVWGDAKAETTFKKNLNLRIKNAVSVKNTVKSGKSAQTVVNGGIQLIIDKTTKLEGNINSIKGLKAKKGIWQLTCVSGNPEKVTFTEKAGTFSVQRGYFVTAVNEKGKEFYSKNEILKLPKGKYEITVEQNISNNGEKITFNADSELDISRVKHTKKADKLFVGWINTKTSKPVQMIDEYKKGDTLEAKYIDFTESDFYMEEAQVRADGDAALRYVFTQNKAAIKKIPEIIEYGSIILPTDMANGRELFLNTPVVHEWKWDAGTLDNFLPSITGDTPSTVVAKNILEENVKNLKYTLCLTEISETRQLEFYGVRGYIKYKDSNGIERITYTKYEQSSLYKAAAETAEAEKTAVHNDIIKYAEVDDRALYWQMYPIEGYLDTKVKGQENDPNFVLYSQAGLTIGDVTINSGFRGIEPTEICFITDPHLNYINEQDIFENRQAALASYRGRNWLRDGSSGKTISNVMKYVANFKKTVMGGDSVDYLSDGAIEMTRRLIGDKSINGSIKMVLGNHETSEGCQPDIDVVNKYSVEERLAMLQEDWTNNVLYDSDIMKSSSGKDNVMLIYLENGFGKYHKEQIEPLKRDIAIAKEKQIPVIIFQHIPMSVNGVGKDAAPESIEVTNLIRMNSDVIKGMFVGHEHQWEISKIVAVDGNGNANGKYIPQYTAYGAHYSGVMKITVK